MKELEQLLVIITISFKSKIVHLKKLKSGDPRLISLVYGIELRYKSMTLLKSILDMLMGHHWVILKFNIG